MYHSVKKGSSSKSPTVNLSDKSSWVPDALSLWGAPFKIEYGADGVVTTSNHFFHSLVRSQADKSQTWFQVGRKRNSHSNIF